MYRFVGELERSAELQNNLADLFDLAESVFNFWLRQDKENWKARIPNESANLALVLDVQACRLFRSVIEDCSRSEGFTASILARTLFETTLCAAFVLKKDVRIIVEPIAKGNPPGGAPTKYVAKLKSKHTKRTRKHLLSREFRAKLVFAHDYFLLVDRGFASVSKFPGLYQRARQFKKGIDPKVTAEYEQEIGPAWCYILRRSDNLAGLAVKELAKALHKGFLNWYETIYHFQSRAVHGFDLLKHVDISDGVNLKASFLSTDRHVHESLWAATGMFLTHVQILHQNIDFGTEVDLALHSLKRKFKRIAKKVP